MLRRFGGIWLTLFGTIHIGLSCAVFCLSYFIRFHPAVTELVPIQSSVPPFEQYVGVLPILALILLVANRSQRLYSYRREDSLLAEFVDIVKATVLAVVLLTAVLFFERSSSYARGIVAIFAVLNPCAAILLRAVVRSALRFARRRGRNLRHILIVGLGRTAQTLIHRIRENPWTGLRVKGLIADREGSVGKSVHGLPVIGTIDGIGEVLERSRPDQVFIALPPERASDVEALIHELSERMVDVRIVPHLGFLLGMERRTVDFDGLPIVSLWETPIYGWNAILKQAMDHTLAFAALILTLPVFAIAAVLVKLTSPGPVFYRQARMGLDGRLFKILKFRTMRAGDDDDERPGWTRPGDPRCTAVGRFFRRTSIDELPQLLNVLAGQMSLVGPRPERPVFIEKFKKTIPRYMLRHKVKAGMTGWAQVNGWRGDTSLKKRIQYDLYYLRHWSLGFDLKILALTLVRGWMHPNAY
jgi:Undecaprenyl-phosphate glucose phosphotransferase